MSKIPISQEKYVSFIEFMRKMKNRLDFGYVLE